jgi:Flp pilus assembly protein TadD
MRPKRAAILILAAGGLTALAGCQGHGAYTTEALDQARHRMSSIQAATRWDLAHQQYLAGDLKKALTNVTQSIELHETVPQSHVLHGRILLELGQLESAIKALDRAIELDPSTADPHYYRGIVFERFSDYVEAHESYETASLLEPSDPQYAIAAAEMLIQLDLLDKAEETLLKRSREHQHNAGIKQTLGHIALLRENYDVAVDHFREARLLATDDLSIVEDLVAAQTLAGDWVEAEFNLRQLLSHEDYANRRDLKQMQARCLAALDRPVEARSILLALTDTPAGSADASVWIDLGKVALALGDERRVKICAAKAIALAPDRHEGHMLEASLELRSSNFEAALAALSTAAELSRNDPRPAMLRGVVLQQLGRHDEASASFAQALRIAPDDERAQKLIANVPLD